REASQEAVKQAKGNGVIEKLLAKKKEPMSKEERFEAIRGQKEMALLATLGAGVASMALGKYYDDKEKKKIKGERSGEFQDDKDRRIMLKSRARAFLIASLFSGIAGLTMGVYNIYNQKREESEGTSTENYVMTFTEDGFALDAPAAPDSWLDFIQKAGFLFNADGWMAVLQHAATFNGTAPRWDEDGNWIGYGNETDALGNRLTPLEVKASEMVGLLNHVDELNKLTGWTPLKVLALKEQRKQIAAQVRQANNPDQTIRCSSPSDCYMTLLDRAQPLSEAEVGEQIHSRYMLALRKAFDPHSNFMNYFIDSFNSSLGGALISPDKNGFVTGAARIFTAIIDSGAISKSLGINPETNLKLAKVWMGLGLDLRYLAYRNKRGLLYDVSVGLTGGRSSLEADLVVFGEAGKRVYYEDEGRAEDFGRLSEKAKKLIGIKREAVGVWFNYNGKEMFMPLGKDGKPDPLEAVMFVDENGNGIEVSAVADEKTGQTKIVTPEGTVIALMGKTPTVEFVEPAAEPAAGSAPEDKTALAQTGEQSTEKRYHEAIGKAVMEDFAKDGKLDLDPQTLAEIGAEANGFSIYRPMAKAAVSDAAAIAKSEGGTVTGETITLEDGSVIALNDENPGLIKEIVAQGSMSSERIKFLNERLQEISEGENSNGSEPPSKMTFVTPVGWPFEGEIVSGGIGADGQLTEGAVVRIGTNNGIEEVELVEGTKAYVGPLTGSTPQEAQGSENAQLVVAAASDTPEATKAEKNTTGDSLDERYHEAIGKAVMEDFAKDG
ncbi:MAG: hypothetical protein AAB356_05025, partial [Deltaproteobacteria bacterium]